MIQGVEDGTSDDNRQLVDSTTLDRRNKWVPLLFIKQKMAYEMLRSLVGSEICIRERYKHA